MTDQDTTPPQKTRLTPDDRCVIVSLCENDEYGMPSGKVTGAHFTDALNYDTPPVLELESNRIDDDFEPAGPRCDREGRTLIVGELSYEVRDFRPHVGNIFWNGYVITLRDARRMANDLSEHQSFTVDAWDEGQPFLSGIKS